MTTQDLVTAVIVHSHKRLTRAEREQLYEAIRLADAQDEAMKRLALVPRVIVSLNSAPASAGPSDA